MLSTVRCRRAAAATPAAQQQRRNAAAELGLPKSKRAGDSERAQEREVGICVSVPMTSSVRCPNPPPRCRHHTHFCLVRFVPFIRYGNRSAKKRVIISCYLCSLSFYTPWLSSSKREGGREREGAFGASFD